MIYPPALETFVIGLSLAIAGYYGVQEPRHGFIALGIAGYAAAAFGFAWLLLGEEAAQVLHGTRLGSERP